MAEETSDILQEYNNLLKSREFGSKTWVDDFFKKNHLLAEIQALEACDWLKETGFPQYAHMYQDGQMPIDLEVAKRDHLFLDEISLRSLFCRLEILNKCFDLNICPSSEVKLRSHGKHDVSSHRHMTDGGDNDDDVEIALSNRWTYEPLSHRWSRSCEGESTTCSPTNLEFSQSEVEKMDAAVESDVESNISEVNGSGLESSSESKSFEDVADVTDPEETLKRDKSREGRVSKPDSGLMDSEFMGKIDKICSSSSREEATTSGSKPGSGWRPPIQRGFSENSGVQLFENLDEYYEPDYRDIFDSLADLSKSLMCDDGDESSGKKRQSSDDYCDAMMTSSSTKKEMELSEVGFNKSAIIIRRKQTNRDFLARMGHSFEQSTTSSLSSSTLSTPSSHSSLSMASYTLHGNLQDPGNQSHFKPAAHHQLHQLQQHLHQQQQQQQQKQQQQQHHHQNLAVTLSTRSENSYLSSRFIDANILQTKSVAKKLLSKAKEKERKAFLDEISDDLDELRAKTDRPPTMYASRDSFSPSECNLASRYCFPKAPRHRQPPPPSPLLTRAADKIRGAFNFLRKIDGPGSVRRSLKKKENRNVENAQKDFVGGLLKNDIGHPGQGRLSADLESKVESLKCFDVERSQKTILQKLESPESCPQNGNLSRKDPLVEAEIPLEDDDTLRPKKHQGRKMSTYDNVFSSHDFDKILNDLYTNIFLLDQSLVCETDEESKSQTGSLNTPSSSSESQEPRALSPDARPSSDHFHEILDETETDTLKSRGRSGEAFKRDVDKHDDEEDSDEEGDDNDDKKRWRYPDVGERERRDSGVGSSLTRRPSNRRTVRWQSFLKDRSEYSITDLSRLSAQQMAILERYCLLRITSILEKYGSISRKSWKNLMNRKQKAVCLSDYPQRAVFGVPLEVLRIRYGQALPKCVLLAMKKLRRSIEDCDGIFRKAGAKVRVQALKDAIVSDPESIDYEESSVHDLADILKAFLKELPDCLFTGRFSKILTNIFKNVPKDLHMESVQACLVLMPNDHRDCLHTFMLFTHYLAKHSHITQMNASNLALCLSPSFFHLESASSTPNSRKQQSAYKKCIDEQKFVHQCLTFVVENAPFLFTNFQGFFDSCHISPSSNLANSGYLMLRENMDQQYNANLCSARLKYLFQFVMKEAKSSSRGWSVPNVISSSALISPSSTLPLLSMLSSIPHMSVEVSYKKAGDSSYPLRLWRCSMLVEAPPVEVLTRILWDRHLWDFDLLKWRWVEKIDNNTEVFQYVLNSMAPHPPRMYTDLRSWKVNLTTGSCTLVCQSVEYPRTHAGFSVPAEVQASHYHIEPCGSGRCRLTLISRIDFKGHSLSWYNHTYDHMVASQLLRISLTLANNLISSNLPETKV